VEDIYRIIRRINDEQKTSILLVEQNARAALGIAHFGYVMENGKIVMEDAAANLRENPDVKEFYLGINDEETKKSYAEVKHYKRRKRWLS
jgi:branched-chain amino acid transport system ATP-binding protein